MTIDDVITEASAAILGKPIVENIFRGTLVEAIVALALQQAGWKRTDSWAGWDLEHDDRMRLEVKQTAARQTWDATRTIDRKPKFEIRHRTGHYDSTGWVPSDVPSRLADLYVFAHHPVTNATADHRDPAQWLFYVVPTNELPPTKEISLTKVRQLATPATFGDLAARVAVVAAGLREKSSATIGTNALASRRQHQRPAQRTFELQSDLKATL